MLAKIFSSRLPSSPAPPWLQTLWGLKGTRRIWTAFIVICLNYPIFSYFINVNFYFKLSSLVCWEIETDITGINIIHESNVTTISDCQKLCQAQENCKFFTYGLLNQNTTRQNFAQVCWLKSSIGTSSVDLAHVSGPKVVPRELEKNRNKKTILLIVLSNCNQLLSQRILQGLEQ